MNQTLGTVISSPLPYTEAVERVTAALKAEGFGVLTRIDVHDTLQEKIGVAFHPYSILGACNPVLAHRALEDTPEVGLLLPCNVTVEAADGGSIIRIINPQEMMAVGGLGERETLVTVGTEAAERLARVADALN